LEPSNGIGVCCSVCGRPLCKIVATPLRLRELVAKPALGSSERCCTSRVLFCSKHRIRQCRCVALFGSCKAQRHLLCVSCSRRTYLVGVCKCCFTFGHSTLTPLISRTAGRVGAIGAVVRSVAFARQSVGSVLGIGDGSAKRSDRCRELSGFCTEPVIVRSRVRSVPTQLVDLGLQRFQSRTRRPRHSDVGGPSLQSVVATATHNV